MRHFFLLLFFLFSTSTMPCFGQDGTQMTTLIKGKEFFNGTVDHLYAYLNNNYSQLDRLEGIWTFTKFDYDEYGIQTSETPNFCKSAIVRVAGEYKRAFIEVNLERALCKQYQVVYNIQTGGGSIYYPIEPQGCMSASGRYTYNAEHVTISREGVSFSGGKSVLIGVKIFPQGQRAGQFVMPDAPDRNPPRPSPGMIAPRKDRAITDPDGWEPFIDWGKQIFPSYLVSTSNLDPGFLKPDENYLGDPLSVVGVAVNCPRNGAKIKIEIGSTRYSESVSQEFVLLKRGVRYTVFPTIDWDYQSLFCISQAFPMSITYKVTLNDKTTTETVVARMRAIDDCPLKSYDYRGELIDLRPIFAAYVNENHPELENIRKEILKKGTVSAFVGYQSGEAMVYQQVYAFWKYLRDKGVKYSSITNNGENEHPEVFSQRVRLLEDVIKSDQANCIDGTAIFASCLLSVGIDPIIVIIPNHAFLGYYLDAEHKEYRFLETTLIGSTETPPSCTPANPAFVDDVTKALKSTDNAAAVARFANATCHGIGTYLEKHDVAMLVDVHTARQHIKPLYRCNQSVVLVQPPPPTDILDKIDKTKGPPDVSDQTHKTSDADTQQVSDNKTGETPPPPPAIYLANDPAQTPALYRGMAPPDSLPYSTNAPAKNGTYYKVQLEGVGKFDPNHPVYAGLQAAGYRIDVEYLPTSKRYRVMVGDFKTEAEALPAAHKAQSLFEANKKSYTDKVFPVPIPGIVPYQDGNRGAIKYRYWSELYTPPKKLSDKKN